LASTKYIHVENAVILQFVPTQLNCGDAVAYDAVMLRVGGNKLDVAWGACFSVLLVGVALVLRRTRSFAALLRMSARAGAET
jgi:hypothetical protein